jgi:hypothetical protein
LPQLNQQNKTKQLGWCGIIIGKINHTTTTPPLIFGMHPYLNPTRSNMEDTLNILKWKTTSILLKKEDDLNFYENGRRPQKKYATN